MVGSILYNIFSFIICLGVGALYFFFPFFKKRKETNLKTFFKEEKTRFIVSIILSVGFITRTFLIDIIPGGLNQDEASAAYEAYAIMTTGHDRNGMQAPAHFIAWGSGQNVLYSYLMIPFIAIFGVNTIGVRLPMALVGCGSIFLLYKALKDFYNEKIAIIGLIFLIITPWHFMKSRWGLESNLFPDLILYGIITMMYAFKKEKWWILMISSVIFGLSAYSYGTSYFFLFLFIIGAYLYLTIVKKVKWWQSLINVGVVAVVALPIIIFVFINILDKETVRFLWMDIPKLEVDRFGTVTNIYSNNFFKDSFDHLVNGFKLLLTQNDNLIFNDLPGIGTVYLITLPFTLIGIFKKAENKEFSWLMRIALIVSILMMAIIDPNVNRINVIYIPIIFFSIIGIYEVFKLNKLFERVIGISYLVYFLIFNISYFGPNGKEIGYSFQKGYVEAVECALKIENVNEYYITNHANMPYIYVLLEDKYDANKYIEEVVFINEGQSFEQVREFGNYHFYLPSKLQEGNVYIISVWDTKFNNVDLSSYKVTEFERYKVVDTTI